MFGRALYGKPRPARVAGLGSERAAACARLHAEGFSHPWDAHDFERLIGASSGIGHAAVDERDSLVGFILSRRAADEAEVLTIVVDPGRRGQGIGGVLLRANIEALGRAGVKTLFLDVGEDNDAARRLYARHAFVEVGRRPGYYRGAEGRPVSALTLRCDTA